MTLPLHRLVAEWTPMPEWELPVRSYFLHLPRYRSAYNVFERVLFALAVVGAWLGWRRDAALVVIVVLLVATRAALDAFAHPCPVERYMVESFPAMMALAGVALASLLRWRIPAARACVTPAPVDPAPRRDARARRNEGTPQTPAARASSVAARSASLMAGVSMAPSSPNSRSTDGSAMSRSSTQ